MMPSTLVARDELPLTISGKTDRIAVESLLYQCLQACGQCDPLAFLCEAVSLAVSAPISHEAAGLLELGVGSLTTARLTAELMHRYGVQLTIAEIIGAGSLAELADMVRDRLPRP